MPALQHLTARVALGAPGVYTLAPEPVRALTGVRLDGCAFVGVAPRGPCRVPRVERSFDEDWRLCDPAHPRLRSVAVRVNSFDDYRRLYGGYEGPGLLPYAVASFFEQGGREAWVVRIVHEHGSAALNAQGAAQAVLGGLAGAPLLHARNEGSWGNQLKAQLVLNTRALPATPLAPGDSALQLAAGQRLPAGTLLRLRLVDGSHVLRFVAEVLAQGDALQPRRLLVATLDAATPAAIAAAEVVEAELQVHDGAGASEHFAALGLHVDHPRWLASVLCRESALLWPDFAWAGDRLLPGDALLLRGGETAPFSGGEDRHAALTHGDFFDPAWDPREDEPASGLQAVAGTTGVTQIVLPDLYQPAPLPPQADVRDPSLAGPDFAPCVELPLAPPTPANTAELPGLLLDPADPADLAQIVALFQQVQDFVETTRDHIALLDVPPGLKPAQVAAFRSHFDSSYCALYHPWLAVPTAEDGRDALVTVPPAAAAAGIVAARELALGVPHGPANEVVRQALRPLQMLSSAEHDALHPLGINVLLQQPRGVVLTAARTLSLDAAWRQLSVRRLLLLLRRTLQQQMQWAVFEPHTPALRRQVVQMLTVFLRRLFTLGAFTGATEEEAFFVQCDDDLNPPGRVDQGELLAHVGVAPAEPLEFIVLQLRRSGDGTLVLEGRS
jgi:hypothetical protein